MPTTLSEVQRLCGIVSGGLPEGVVKSLEIWPIIGGRPGGMLKFLQASLQLL